MRPAQSIRPCTVEDDSASSCPARTARSFRTNRMKGSTAVGRLPCGTRGCGETGSDEPATLALHRKSYPKLSDYPMSAQGMRGSRYRFWSSLPFPRLLIDELAAPHLCCFRSTARRYVQYRKQHATHESTDLCASRPACVAPSSRRNPRFLFQECIATTAGDMHRSLNATKQCRKGRRIRRIGPRERRN